MVLVWLDGVVFVLWLFVGFVGFGVTVVFGLVVAFGFEGVLVELVGVL